MVALHKNYKLLSRNVLKALAGDGAYKLFILAYLLRNLLAVDAQKAA